MKKYIAKIYFGKNELIDCSEDSVEDLYTWMLAQAEKNYGDIHGEIIDNQTDEVIRRFRRVPPD